MATAKKAAPAAFQSTLPVRGATSADKMSVPTDRFQSTLPVRGATYAQKLLSMTDEFQSTLPVRGATARGNPLVC